MRTVYLGTTDFAAAVLERLARSAHRPALVVTRPDRPTGRGRRLRSPPVADAARELGIEVDQPESVNDEGEIGRIADAGPLAVCLCAFGALIREPLLSAHEIFNVHPSLLPRWRGAAPVERAIQAGDTETGVSIMRLVADLDAGPVYLARSEPIRPDDDYGALAPRLAALGGDLLVRALDERPDPVPQPEEGVTYAEKIDRSERRLDPERPAEELARTVRAFTPHIGTYVQLGAEDRLGVRRARTAAGEGPGPGQLDDHDDSLLFGTVDGTLELLEVQPAGGRPMSAGDYLRGRVRSDRQDSRNG
ncbi:MAG: methionyl-tRNA formyltransferase [Thermoleophilaceae bacterium]|nr:methionyl-tRNA formyltransferase [Thermoleophilaceae bacterium]